MPRNCEGHKVPDSKEFAKLLEILSVLLLASVEAGIKVSAVFSS
jgi:hypothetical protein